MAVVVVMGVLMVLSILATVVLSQSTLFGKQSSTSRDSQRALQAAEAGLQSARYRLDNVTPKPKDTQCVTSSAVNTGTGGAAVGECPAATGTLGNGATYSYTVTPVGNTQCGGSALASGSFARCVTSTGAINGVKRRLQARVDGTKTPTKNPYFPLNGILGVGSISKLGNGTATQPLTINGSLGSDGQIDLGNYNVITGGCQVTSAGSVTGGSSCATTRITDPPTWRSSLASVDSLDFNPTFLSNRNETGISQLNPGVGSWSYTSGTKSVSYPTGDTRSLAFLKNGSQLVLQGGDYNLCNLDMNNGGSLLVPAGQTVRIFIDSYARNPTSTGVRGCQPKLNGTPIQVGNDAVWNGPWSGNTSPTPGQLQVFVYGEPGNTKTTTTVDLNNGYLMNSLIYAPWSNIAIGNDVTWNGAAVGQDFTALASFSFNFDTTGSGGSSSDATAFRRKFWRECRREPTTSTDPESGCT